MGNFPLDSYVSKLDVEEYVRNPPTLTPSATDLKRAAERIESVLDVPEEVRAAVADLAIQLIEEGCT